MTGRERVEGEGDRQISRHTDRDRKTVRVEEQEVVREEKLSSGITNQLQIG